MIKYIFVRHGMTQGNLQKKYIGITDEMITEESAISLHNAAKQGIYGDPDIIFSSPMIRCIQTADIIYPNRVLCLVDGFKECDFGIFENKNYKDLKDDCFYQKWLDSNGQLPFPGGEVPEKFKARCFKAFAEAEDKIIKRYLRITDNEDNTYKNVDITAAFVVHGGTIMSIFEQCESSGKDFYNWMTENGNGFEAEHIVKGKFRLIKSIGGI